MDAATKLAPPDGARSPGRASLSCPLLLVLIIVAGLTRAWFATRADGPTIDEAWHAVAGASYVRSGDFRLNPEHPPLVKLWVGAFLPERVLRLPPVRPLVDKEDERALINEAFYLKSDPDQVHARARLAMLALHGLLLIAFALATERVFGPLLSSIATALLLVDPSVAAHLPAVLTDLPLALLSAVAVLMALLAFRSWRPRELALASLALGLALAAKHSGLITALGVGLLGAVMVVRRCETSSTVRRAGSLLGVLAGGWVVLWACYGFRFAEGSPAAYRIAPSVGSAAHACSDCGPQLVAVAEGASRADPGATASGALASGVLASEKRSGPEREPVLFNRSLTDKLADLRSGTHRAALGLAVSTHLLPRAYLWGLADVLRVGVEGRQETLYLWGRRLLGDTPWYFFPAVLSVKLPLGSILLALFGAALALARRMPGAWREPVAVMAAWAGFFSLCLTSGNSGYAGVRHAMPVLPVVALFGAIALAYALNARVQVSAGGLADPRDARFPAATLSSGELALRVAAASAAAALLFAALPVRRPWEFYNQLVGGSREAWRFFTDDGLDNGQRTRELANYYDRHVRGSGEPAYDFYGVFAEERRFRKLSFRALSDEPLGAPFLSGTMFVNARWLAPRLYYDYGMFRDAEPVARFGNLLVYRGRFRVPWLDGKQTRAQAHKALAQTPPDDRLAEQLLRTVSGRYPEDYRSSFELGNLLTERGDHQAAARAYARSRAHAPPQSALVSVLTRQIEALSVSQGARVRPLRNPWLE